MTTGVKRFPGLRAWQSCDQFRLDVLRICAEEPLASDRNLRWQLERAAAGPAAHVAEGYGRFHPPDFAQYGAFARASLMEAQNHLRDAAQRGYISNATHQALDAQAVNALKQVTALMLYLKTPRALENARRIRQRRLDRDLERGHGPGPEGG